MNLPVLDAVCKSKQVVVSPVPGVQIVSPAFLLRSDRIWAGILRQKYVIFPLSILMLSMAKLHSRTMFAPSCFYEKTNADVSFP